MTRAFMPRASITAVLAMHMRQSMWTVIWACRESRRVFAAMLAASCLVAWTGSAFGLTFHDAEATGVAEYADPISTVGKITDSGILASGVYLGDGKVLTAAHVVDNASSLSFTLNGASYSADAWAWHSNWDTSNIAGGADLAIVQLADPVTPGTSAASPYRDTDELNQQALIVGFGLTGDGEGYDNGSGHQRRAGTNVIDVGYNGSDDDVLVADFDDGTFVNNGVGIVSSSRSPTTYEASLAPGDSGGGVFLYDEAVDEWLLAGINSFGGATGRFDNDDPNGSYGDLSGFTRVSSYADWIDAVFAADLTHPADVEGLLDVNVFPMPIPEPSSALVAAGLLLLAASRRHRTRR